MGYITPEMLAFLSGIRTHNDKEWFEAHKSIYQQAVQAPLAALAEQLFAPYADKPDMMHKVARIYRDANFPPYLHYRDTMWIYVRHEAMYWSRTPTLFFEVSPEGARFGFRIASPQPAYMEYFRRMLGEDPSEFLGLVRQLESSGLPLSGEEYKRPKPCPDEALRPYFQKRSLAVESVLGPGEALFSEALPERVLDVFARVFPLHEYCQGLLTEWELSRIVQDAVQTDPAPPMPKAPAEEFMW